MHIYINDMPLKCLLFLILSFQSQAFAEVSEAQFKRELYELLAKSQGRLKSESEYAKYFHEWSRYHGHRASQFLSSAAFKGNEIAKGLSEIFQKAYNSPTARYTAMQIHRAAKFGDGVQAHAPYFWNTLRQTTMGAPPQLRGPTNMAIAVGTFVTGAVLMAASSSSLEASALSKECPREPVSRAQFQQSSFAKVLDDLGSLSGSGSYYSWIRQFIENELFTSTKETQFLVFERETKKSADEIRRRLVTQHMFDNQSRYISGGLFMKNLFDDLAKWCDPRIEAKWNSEREKLKSSGYVVKEPANFYVLSPELGVTSVSFDLRNRIAFYRLPVTAATSSNRFQNSSKQVRE